VVTANVEPVEVMQYFFLGATAQDLA